MQVRLTIFDKNPPGVGAEKAGVSSISGLVSGIGVIAMTGLSSLLSLSMWSLGLIPFPPPPPPNFGPSKDPPGEKTFMPEIMKIRDFIFHFLSQSVWIDIACV